MSDLGGPFVERSQWEIDCNFINDIFPEKLRQAIVVAGETESGLLKFRHSAPFVIHESQKPAAAFRHGFNPASKANGPRVRPKNEYMMQVPAAPANNFKNRSKEQPRGDDENRGDHPEHQEEGNRHVRNAE